MTKHTEVGKIYSWPIITLFIIIFWPVGLFLIYKRTEIEHGSGLKTTSKFLKYLCYFCFFISVSGVILLMTGEFTLGNLGLSIFFFIAGGSLLYYNKYLENTAIKYKKYHRIIVNGRIRSLNEIATSIDLPLEIVKKDLKAMLNKDYIQGAYLSDADNSIVFFDELDLDDDEDNEIPARIITCSCCGAKNKINTTYGECEYCEAPL